MSSEILIIGKSLMNIHETLEDDITRSIIMDLRDTTSAGFEPARAEPNGFQVHLLNHSDKLSYIHYKPILFIFFNNNTMNLCRLHPSCQGVEPWEQPVLLREGCLPRQKIPNDGLEPSASGLLDPRSNQLS